MMDGMGERKKTKKKKKKEGFAFIYKIRLLHVFPPCKIRFLFLSFLFLFLFTRVFPFIFLSLSTRVQNAFLFLSCPFLSLHFLHFIEQSVIVITHYDQLLQIFNEKKLIYKSKVLSFNRYLLLFLIKASVIQISLFIVNIKLSRNFYTISYMFYIRFLIC